MLNVSQVLVPGTIELPPCVSGKGGLGGGKCVTGVGRRQITNSFNRQEEVNLETGRMFGPALLGLGLSGIPGGFFLGS